MNLRPTNERCTSVFDTAKQFRKATVSPPGGRNPYQHLHSRLARTLGFRYVAGVNVGYMRGSRQGQDLELRRRVPALLAGAKLEMARPMLAKRCRSVRDARGTSGVSKSTLYMRMKKSEESGAVR